MRATDGGEDGGNLNGDILYRNATQDGECLEGLWNLVFNSHRIPIRVPDCLRHASENVRVENVSRAVST